MPVEELPLSDSVREAMAITLRGCDELLIESEFAQKLARSEKNGKPLRIKLGLDPDRARPSSGPYCRLEQDASVTGSGACRYFPDRRFHFHDR